MRGGRGYYPRNSGYRRGGVGGSGGSSNYRSSNNYNGGNRMGSSSKMGRYEGGGSHYSGGSSHRHHTDDYDTRMRGGDRFSTASGGRRDVTTKRSYADSSRDRSDDRKRSRNDDYRRPSSIGRGGNRTPPPPPPPMISNSSSYRGLNNSSGNYRSVMGSGGSGGGRNERDSSLPRHRSSPKRMMRSSGIGGISRPRGSLTSSSNRGLRPATRGIIRTAIRSRESADLRLMRRKLLYARQKDRQRVLKIQRLTSSLRRRRMGVDSKSPRDSLKKSSSDEENDDEDNKKDGEEKSDTEAGGSGKKKSSSTVKRSDSVKRSKSSEKRDDGDGVHDEAEGSSLKSKASAGDEEDLSSSKQGDKKNDDASAEADGQNDTEAGGKKAESKESKSKDKADGKRDGKKTDGRDESDVEEERRKDKSSKKTAGSSSGLKTTKSSNDRHKELGSRDNKRAHSRRDDHGGARKNSRFIQLTCIHCHMKCVTFLEYSKHLYSHRHKTAIYQVAVRQRAYLMRLRMNQRTAQREIEEKSKEEHESKFCHLCRLNYRQPKAKHQLSEHHKTIKKFLMPYCSTCHLAFKSPMLYETHRCSLEHIRNKARKNDSDSDKSGDEMREIDLGKYLTVDSVGEIDEDLGADIDVDAMLNESNNGQDANDDNNFGLSEEAVAANSKQYIEEVSSYLCTLCDTYSSTKGGMDAFLKKHCSLRSHIRAYSAQKKKESKEKKERELKKKEEEQEKSHETNGDDTNDVAESEGIAKSTRASDDLKDVLDDEALWKDVDKDLGELLAEVQPDDADGDADGEGDEEDEAVLNIDIESEKPKPKEMNGKKEETKKAASPTTIASPQKPKPARKPVTTNKSQEVKEE